MSRDALLRVVALSFPPRVPSGMAEPRAVIIRAPGTNCDAEMARAFALAGAAVDLVHIDALTREPALLDQYGLIGFAGGFSYGDDIASGRIFAMRLREKLYPALRDAVARSTPIIGACNGFQILVQVGLLPGPDDGHSWPEELAPPQSVSLCDNVSARFCDRWVEMRSVPASRCIWTRGVEEAIPAALRPDLFMLPVAHGEGRLVCKSPEVLDALERSGRVAIRYADNFNGSDNAIAGLCDGSGLIFGLMPHPERFLDWTRHPYWTRLPAHVRSGPTPGLRMFQNAVAHVRGEALVTNA